jgi:hypothetical protein
MFTTYLQVNIEQQSHCSLSIIHIAIDNSNNKGSAAPGSNQPTLKQVPKGCGDEHLQRTMFQYSINLLSEMVVLGVLWPQSVGQTRMTL